MEKKETKTTAPEVKAEVKETVKAAAPEAVKEVKAEVKEAAKTETKKAAAPKKSAAAKKPGRKPAAKKPAAAKKTETAEVKKPAAAKKPGRKPGSKTKKAETEIKTVVQSVGFQGQDADVVAIQEKILAKFVAEGHRAGTIKKFEIYINVEEKKAYYVINGKSDENSYVDLF